jgi:hypothetical protein
VDAVDFELNMICSEASSWGRMTTSPSAKPTTALDASQLSDEIVDPKLAEYIISPVDQGTKKINN